MATELDFLNQLLDDIAARITLLTGSSGTPNQMELVIAGDSIGNGAINGENPWAGMAFTHSGSPVPYSVQNFSVAGDYLDQMAFINLPNIEAVFTAAYGPNGCWLVIQAGTNDLAAGAVASYMYGTDCANLVSTWHTLGGRVCIATILPRANTVYAWTTAMETQRAAYNALVIANTLGADSIADIASASGMSTPTSTAEYIDGLHPTATAYDAYVKPVYLTALSIYL